MKFGLPLVALCLVVFAVIHVMGTEKPTENVPPAIAPPRNPFPKTVAGSGVVEAETENIKIGSPVPGVVVHVDARVGEEVKPGAELFRLDDRQLQSELKFREAAAAAADADLTRLENQPRQEQLLMSQATVAEAEANAAEQRDQLARARELVRNRVTTDQDLVTREQTYRASQAKLRHAQADLAMTKAGAWEYDKQVARAAGEQARAQVHQVQTEIDRLRIRSQVAGEILQVNVRPGEFVGAPPSQALVVVGNVKQLHVRVDIDEYDIHRFSPGAQARAMMKGHPERQFPLAFVRVEPYVIPKRSLTGENTERVDTRVLQVIYSLERGEEPLYVGQQVDVFIDAEKSVGGK